jgi:hypothetical protein
MQVAFGKDSRYLLKDFISQKEKEYHVADMKPFKFKFKFKTHLWYP